MHIEGTFPESITLLHEDTEWIQPVDYEHVPFQCYKFHDHGHHFRYCPKNKLEVDHKKAVYLDDDGFKKVTNRRHQNRKTQYDGKSSIPTTSNNFDIEENQPKETENMNVEDHLALKR
jgi:hypothetical protein